jgi:integrase
VISSRERKSLNRNHYNSSLWRRGLAATRLEVLRADGCHALRHFHASTLLDAGESIKAVSQYLGHADAGFTLRTYTHLMPASDERARRPLTRCSV